MFLINEIRADNKIAKSLIDSKGWAESKVDKRIKKWVKADTAELRKLFDEAVRGNIPVPLAVDLINNAREVYKETMELYQWGEVYFHFLIKGSTPTFIDDNFIEEYSGFHLADNPPDSIRPLIPIKALGITEQEASIIKKEFCYLVEVFEDDREEYLRFDSTWYDWILDNCTIGFWAYWKDVNQMFADKEVNTLAWMTAEAFIKTELTPTIEQLEQMIPTATESKPHTIPQEIDSTDKPWKENYEAVIGVYKLFKEHLPILKEQEYIIINDKRKTFTWNLHKASKADLARYFAAIKPQNSRVALWQEIITLFDLKIETQTMASHVSKAKYSETFDGIYKLLHLDELKTKKS